MKPSFKQLEAFVLVAQTGSFTAASKRMHVSQPALTSMVKKLEAQLQTTLFERDVKGAILTTSGRELLPSIERILSELSETIDLVVSSNNPEGGVVRVACIPSIAAHFMPPRIVQFEKLYPSIRVIVRDAMTENRDILEQLRCGAIDLGIASPSQDMAEFQYRNLIEDELVAIVTDNWNKRTNQPLSWSDLAAEPIIGMSNQSHVRQLMDDGFAKVGISKHPHQEVSLITTAVGMVKAGLGIAILPNSAAALCNLDGVRVEPISEPKVHRNLGLVFKSVENLSQPAKRLVSFLTQGG